MDIFYTRANAEVGIMVIKAASFVVESGKRPAIHEPPSRNPLPSFEGVNECGPHTKRPCYNQQRLLETISINVAVPPNKVIEERPTCGASVKITEGHVM